MTFIETDNTLIEVIDWHKYVVRFDDKDDLTFTVRAENPAEAYEVASKARLQ